EPSRGETLHLEVEPLALALSLADQVLGRDDVALETEGEGVHAAVARGRIRLAVQHPAAGLADLELVTRKRVFRDGEQREPESSSVMTIITRFPMPWPPYSSGTDMPK